MMIAASFASPRLRGGKPRAEPKDRPTVRSSVVAIATRAYVAVLIVFQRVSIDGSAVKSLVSSRTPDEQRCFDVLRAHYQSLPALRR